jgi:hypothetical protein
MPPLVVPSERRMQYLHSIAAYQLSIPGYPDVMQCPANAAQSAFVALCVGFADETRRYLEEAQRLQAARSARAR